ncbi:MAG TPA: hypothetical protein VII28_05670 [Puia sp.]
MENNESILYNTNAAYLSLALFLGMLLFLWLGSVVGHKLRKSEDDENNPINTTIVAAVLGLFAFLLAFTFNMSGNRYESRRLNNINEANSVSTAILRANLYSKQQRDSFRVDFKEYTMARINYFKADGDLKAMQKAGQDAQTFAARLWTRATVNAINNAPGLYPSNFMVPALNNMMDSANYNNNVEKLRVPDLIILLLLTLSLICAFFLGYYSIRKGWFNETIAVGFCLLSALVIYTTLDLDRSRTGLIRHHTSQQSVSDLMELFENP